MKLYKVLIAIGDTVRSFYRDYTPYLPPMEGVPGPWLPAVGKPRIYASGYHLTYYPELHRLFPSDAVFEAEGVGEFQTAGDQVTFQKIRLLRRVA